MNFIPYGRQNISPNDVQAVVDVLNSDWITQGPAIERFEKAVSDYCGVKYAVAVSSATAALHLACMAAELGPGDRLWTSPNTFVASANCGRYCGGIVDFVDIDPTTYNMSLEHLADKLARAKQQGTLPKILIPVHFSGQPCQMAEIAELARPYGITLIEDAAHAIGGEYRGKKIGACEYSDMAVFSFHPVKIVTTGEGGMILTNRDDLYKKLLRLRTHGITREAAQLNHEPHGPWYYEQVELGYNYRMTDLQAALGASQMQRLDRFIQRRRELAARYDELLSGLPLIKPFQHADGHSAWHLYVVQVDPKQTDCKRLDVFNALRSANIGVQVHYIPVHTQPDYLGLGFSQGDFPNSEAYYQHCISLPMYYDLSDAEQAYVVDTLKQILAKKTPV